MENCVCMGFGRPKCHSFVLLFALSYSLRFFDKALRFNAKSAMKHADLSASAAIATYECTWVCPCVS